MEFSLCFIYLTQPFELFKLKIDTCFAIFKHKHCNPMEYKQQIWNSFANEKYIKIYQQNKHPTKIMIEKITKFQK